MVGEAATYDLIVPATEISWTLDRLGRLIFSGFPCVSILIVFDPDSIVDSSGMDKLSRQSARYGVSEVPSDILTLICFLGGK